MLPSPIAALAVIAHGVDPGLRGAFPAIAHDVSCPKIDDAAGQPTTSPTGCMSIANVSRNFEVMT